jgi:hypothetical protein
MLDWWNKLSTAKQLGVIMGGLLVVVIIAAIVDSGKGPRPVVATRATTAPTPAPTPKPQIHANVKFSGTQFIIKNEDSFDWIDVKMEVNDRFNLKHPRVSAGQTYTVGALQFADDDGVRFNPFQMKAKEFGICATIQGDIDCYVGGWE